MTNEVLKDKSIEQRLNELGYDYSHWENYGKNRLYLSNKALQSIVGFEAHYHKTGNISACWLDGEKISNCRGNEVLEVLESLKAFYDMDLHKFIVKCDYQSISSRNRYKHIIDWVKNELNDIECEASKTLEE